MNRSSSSPSSLFLFLFSVMITTVIPIFTTAPWGARFLNQSFLEEMINKTRNKTREAHVNETMRMAAGVYRNKTRGKLLKLDKTVITSVVAFDSAGIMQYKVYLQNFLCFAKHYDFDLVVYILHHHIENIEKEIEHLSSMGVRVLTYPDELFWRRLATKKNNMIPSDNRADYNGTVPTFQHHGFFVMLVPVLEILELGYNVIFFDVDIGLVQDPVGDADFVTSLEIHKCPDVYPSASQRDFKWESAEPNTGIMHVRSTPSGKEFFRRWLWEITDENTKSDQKVFNPTLFDAIYTPNCNWNLSAVPTQKPSRFDNATYCILPEILFQNGYVAFTCSTKKNFRDSWLVEMNRNAVDIDSRKYPVTIHANYCNGKSLELGYRGLWLHEYVPAAGSNSSSGTSASDPYAFNCKKYDVRNTYFATLNYTEEVGHINSKRQAVRAAVMKNGTIIKTIAGHEVFMVDDTGHRRVIPDADTFEAMGFQWGHIKAIPTFVMVTIPQGDPFSKIHVP